MANDGSLENPLPDEMLDRYVTGECSESEAVMVWQWMQAHPQSRYLAEAMRRVELVPSVAIGEEDIGRAWLRVMASYRGGRRHDAGISSLTSDLSEERKRMAGRKSWSGREFKTHPLRGQAWFTIATILLGVIAMVVGLRTGESNTQYIHSHAVSVYVTGNGERAAITLPDDNTVTLNVASRLEVPVDYATGDHELRLTGEALFTVLHHAGTPFTVIAGPITTHVLGTSFVVQRYPDDSITVVAVREGKVAVQSMTLTANQVVDIGLTGVSHVRPAGPSPFSFARGVLALDSVALSQAIPRLDRWYDADIRLGDSTLSRKRLFGDLPAGSIAELAQDLDVTLHVQVQREGRVLTLFPR